VIPNNLKPGAILRLTEPTLGMGSSSVKNRLVTLKGYNPKPMWSSVGDYGAMIVELPNNWTNFGDQGWGLRRFVTVTDGDGSDYQADDDIDLQPPHSVQQLTCE
jgi:hypothetical protein